MQVEGSNSDYISDLLFQMILDIDETYNDEIHLLKEKIEELSKKIDNLVDK